MLLKYIVMLLFIYSFGIAKPIDDKEIESLWRKVRIGRDYVNLYSLALILNRYLKRNEIKQLLKLYGQKESFLHGTKKRFTIEYRMSESMFKKFAIEGHMPRWPILHMKAAFIEILPRKVYRDYVTLNEMIEYYSQIDTNLTTNLEEIIRNYGKNEDGERRLYFKGYVRAMNLDLIPAPIL